VCDHAEAAEPADVFYDIASLAPERIRRGRQAERRIVPAAGADFDAVEDEHTRLIAWGIGWSGTVSMVGQHDESETGSGRGVGHLVR
jgi:hypothetical protein